MVDPLETHARRPEQDPYRTRALESSMSKLIPTLERHRCKKARFWPTQSTMVTPFRLHSGQNRLAGIDPASVPFRGTYGVQYRARGAHTASRKPVIVTFSCEMTVPKLHPLKTFGSISFLEKSQSRRSRIPGATAPAPRRRRPGLAQTPHPHHTTPHQYTRSLDTSLAAHSSGYIPDTSLPGGRPTPHSLFPGRSGLAREVPQPRASAAAASTCRFWVNLAQLSERSV